MEASGLVKKLAGAGLVLGLALIVVLSLVLFFGVLTPSEPVIVNAPRSGLVMDPDAKVRMRGVEIGKVAKITSTAEGARLELAIDPELLALVPANASVDIKSTTVFGAKYVNFVVPEQPSGHLRPGAVLAAQAVTVEYNTLFEHLSDVLAKINPEKLNATLGAIGSALQGRGAKLGDLLARSDAYLADINPSLPALRRDMIAAAGATELYSQVMPDLLRTASNAIVTSGTIHAEQRNLDTVLLNVAGLANTGGNVLRENETNLVTALDLLRPTTELLDEYKAALSCLINGLGQALPAGEAIFGGLQEGVALNASFMTGAPAYTYPRDLPKVNATGGPHCMGMPDKPKESHAPYLVTDTATVPYVPNLRVVVDPPKVFQVLFAGLLPGGGAR